MNDQLLQVRNFMLACDQTTRQTPSALVPMEERVLRLKLLSEELDELMDSLGVCKLTTGQLTYVERPVDSVAALDALTDILYVLLGTYHTLGLANHAEAAFAEVHRSNLSKLVDGKVLRRADGKILKPSTYTPPRLERILSK